MGTMNLILGAMVASVEALAAGLGVSYAMLKDFLLLSKESGDFLVNLAKYGLGTAAYEFAKGTKGKLSTPGAIREGQQVLEAQSKNLQFLADSSLWKSRAQTNFDATYATGLASSGLGPAKYDELLLMMGNMKQKTPINYTASPITLNITGPADADSIQQMLRKHATEQAVELQSKIEEGQ